MLTAIHTTAIPNTPGASSLATVDAAIEAAVERLLLKADPLVASTGRPEAMFSDDLEIVLAKRPRDVEDGEEMDDEEEDEAEDDDDLEDDDDEDFDEDEEEFEEEFEGDELDDDDDDIFYDDEDDE